MRKQTAEAVARKCGLTESFEGKRRGSGVITESAVRKAQEEGPDGLGRYVVRLNEALLTPSEIVDLNDMGMVEYSPFFKQSLVVLCGVKSGKTVTGTTTNWSDGTKTTTRPFGSGTVTTERDKSGKTITGTTRTFGSGTTTSDKPGKASLSSSSTGKKK
ncbi:MAG: hypothetical protein NTZ32_11405 [Planctomycetales bacterium]|nr:hypothetical protein [Planctomycetales bacterium]